MAEMDSCADCGHSRDAHLPSGCVNCAHMYHGGATPNCLKFKMADWGHGPNPPIPIWTEANIRAALKGHGPSNDGCSCSWGYGVNHGQEFTTDHIIELLKLNSVHLGVT